MIKYFLILILPTLLFGQEEHPISFFETRDGNDINLKAVNHGNVRYESTLVLEIENLSGYEAPITKMVGVQDTVLFVTLAIPKEKKWSYASSYTYVPKPKKFEAAEMKQALVNSIDGLGSGITVFTKEGCGRSAYVMNQMIVKNIPFKELETSNNDFNGRLMWSLIRIENPEVKEIRFPILLIDGQLTYKIDDLKAYTKALVKKSEYRR